MRNLPHEHRGLYHPRTHKAGLLSLNFERVYSI